jgi:hypothetical protein
MCGCARGPRKRLAPSRHAPSCPTPPPARISLKEKDTPNERAKRLIVQTCMTHISVDPYAWLKPIYCGFDRY